MTTDHILRGAGVGYKKEDGTICMTRCFECGVENYAMSVDSGFCAWCGFNANESTEEEE